MNKFKFKKQNNRENKDKKLIIIVSIIIILLIIVITLYSIRYTNDKKVITTPTPTVTLSPTVTPTIPVTPTFTPTYTAEIVDTYVVDNKFDDKLTLWIKPNIDNKHMCLSGVYLYNGYIVESVDVFYTDIYGNIFMQIEFEGQEYWLLYYSIDANSYYLNLLD